MLGWCWVVVQASGQTSPASLADASLDEILDLDLEDWQGEQRPPRLRLGYRYVHASFGGYRAGRADLSDEDVLYEPSTGEARTDTNFPVLPTEIRQEAHLLDVSYEIVPRIAVGAAWPILRQSTDHVSIVEGYGTFTIDSAGPGDLILQGTGTVIADASHALRLNLGVSLPLGAIDEVGDTPREPGDQQLPYTMQIGSGTWDVPLGFVGSAQTSGAIPVTGGVHGAARIRTGRNARGYRLGDRGTLAAWIGLQPLSWLEPALELSATAWGRVRGEDTALRVPGDFAYPAPVTDPALFGGQILVSSLALSAGLPGARGRMRHQRLEIELGRPVHQVLNGPQPQERWRMSAGLRLAY